MDAGALKHRLLIQNLTNFAPSPSGFKQENWTDGVTVYGAIEPAEGQETAVGVTAVPYLTHLITIRYRTGINATNRFKYNDNGRTRYFNVQSAFSPKESRDFLVCRCREDVSVNA